MKHAKIHLGLAAGTIIALAWLAAANVGTAIAAGPFDNVMAFIVNDAESPVPVVNAGRQRYQTVFAVNASSLEVCEPIEIPDGLSLTINSVGVRAQTDGTDPPRVYVKVVRQFLSASSFFRFSGDIRPVGTGATDTYEGVFNLNVFAGPAGDDVVYGADICIGGISGGATFADARGVVSGYLEPGNVIDGLALP